MKQIWFAALILFLGLVISLPVQARTAIVLATFSDLQSKGFKAVIVQPTHLFHMEQYHDVIQYNDLASDDENSWETRLNKAGFKVETNLSGLGSNDQFADLFVSRIKDAAKDSGISL